MKSNITDLLAKGLKQLGLDLDQSCLEKFDLFSRELCKWNSKINLTSITAPEEIVIKHFIDSLTVAEAIDRRGRLLDIGSGAGFPGIPLNIVFPELEVVSADSVGKKIIFQKNMARLLKLENFVAINARVESLPENLANGFDWIVSRAFADIFTFTRVALPFLKADGIIVAMKGGGGREEVERSAEDLKLIGARVFAIHEFTLPLSFDSRTIIQLKRAE